MIVNLLDLQYATVAFAASARAEAWREILALSGRPDLVVIGSDHIDSWAVYLVDERVGLRAMGYPEDVIERCERCGRVDAYPMPFSDDPTCTYCKRAQEELLVPWPPSPCSG